MTRISTAIFAAAGTGALLVVLSPGVSGVGIPNGCRTGLPGPELVFIPAPGAPYCIDSREVKQSEYAAFLKAAQETAPSQPAECNWNDRLAPIPVSNPCL